MLALVLLNREIPKAPGFVRSRSSTSMSVDSNPAAKTDITRALVEDAFRRGRRCRMNAVREKWARDRPDSLPSLVSVTMMRRQDLDGKS